MKVVVSDYHSLAQKNDCCCCDHSTGLGHRPYRRMLHARDTDWRVAPADMIDHLIRRAGAKDGDEIEVSIRVTGERPFGDRKMMWTSAGTYTREGDNPDGVCIIPESASDEPRAIPSQTASQGEKT